MSLEIEAGSCLNSESFASRLFNICSRLRSNVVAIAVYRNEDVDPRTSYKAMSAGAAIRASFDFGVASKC